MVFITISHIPVERFSHLDHWAGLPVMKGSFCTAVKSKHTLQQHNQILMADGTNLDCDTRRQKVQHLEIIHSNCWSSGRKDEVCFACCITAFLTAAKQIFS